MQKKPEPSTWYANKLYIKGIGIQCVKGFIHRKVFLETLVAFFFFFCIIGLRCIRSFTFSVLVGKRMEYIYLGYVQVTSRVNF